MSDSSAILAGYTAEYMAYSAGPDLHIFAKPDATLDGVETVYCADECEFIRLNCWHFTFERLES